MGAGAHFHRRLCGCRWAIGGAVFLADEVKRSTPEAIRALRREGLRVVMLTGDRQEAAQKIAAELGIEEVQAEVLPQEKGEVVKKLREQGRIVAMAGDGINDAPALAAAEVGIAMGTGTDVAIENAGITLVKGDLNGLVRARRLAHATVGNIRQNLAFACVYNLLGNPDRRRYFLPNLWLAAEPHDRQRGDELQFGVGHHQCFALATRTIIGRAVKFPDLHRAVSSLVCGGNFVAKSLVSMDECANERTGGRLCPVVQMV